MPRKNSTLNLKVHKTMRRTIIFCSSILLCLIVVSGCAIKPTPFTGPEATDMARDLQGRVHVQQEQFPQVLTLDEAIARTMKYNLEHRVKMYEANLRQRQYDLSLYDMLPDITAKGQAEHRSNDDASRSKNLSTGVTSNDYTTSEDRTKRTGSISLSWNILDLGINYYTLHQQANRYLMAKEQQRKVVQDIVSETRGMFLKVLVAQQLKDDVDKTLLQAEEALAKARQIETERLRPLEQVLVYQRGLIQTIKQLEELQRDLALAKVQLAALMNMPANRLPRLVAPSWYGTIITLHAHPSMLEEYAFAHRPEIIQWGYQKRITALEAKKAIFDLVPGIGLNLSSDYSSNSYDLHSAWQQASANVAYNLMNIVKWPAKKKMFEVQEHVEDAQGLAVGMAVLTQVHLAWQQHLFSAQNHARAQQLAEVDERLKALSTLQVQQRQGIMLDSIQKSAAAIVGRLNREQALINHYEAMGNVYNTIGVDYLDAANLPEELAELTRTIADANGKLWTQADLGALLSSPAPTTTNGQNQ